MMKCLILLAALALAEGMERKSLKGANNPSAKLKPFTTDDLDFAKPKQNLDSKLHVSSGGKVRQQNNPYAILVGGDGGQMLVPLCKMYKTMVKRFGAHRVFVLAPKGTAKDAVEQGRTESHQWLGGSCSQQINQIDIDLDGKTTVSTIAKVLKGELGSETDKAGKILRCGGHCQVSEHVRVKRVGAWRVGEWARQKGAEWARGE